MNSDRNAVTDGSLSKRSDGRAMSTSSCEQRWPRWLSAAAGRLQQAAPPCVREWDAESTY